MTGRRGLMDKCEPNAGVTRRQAIALIGATALFALTPGLAQAAAAAGGANTAESFVQQNIERGYNILNSTTLSDTERSAQFRTFMLALTDMRRIGLFTLGPYATRGSKEELDAFADAFTDYAIAVYETRLGKYKGQTLKVTGAQTRAADDVIVNADVVNPAEPNGPVYKASFRVRKDMSGRFIVTDLQVEGVWLALSQRSDFTGFLQQHNGRISDLVSDLKRQTALLRSSARQATK